MKSVLQNTKVIFVHIYLQVCLAHFWLQNFQITEVFGSHYRDLESNASVLVNGRFDCHSFMFLVDNQKTYITF